MKKSLIRLGAVLCLSLAALVCAHLAVGRASDKVEIRETVLAGDRSAARGLEVSYSVYDDSHHLRWDVALTLGGDIVPETDFRFFTGRSYWEIPPEYTVQLYALPLNFGMSGRVAEDDQRDTEYEYMVRPAMDAASRTAPGEKRTEKLRLADYYDCYPLALEAWTPEGPIYSTSWRGSGRTLDREEWQKVNDYFRMPVPPEAMVTVTAERNEAGELVEISCEETEAAEQFTPMSSLGVASGEALYLPVIPSQEAPDQVAAGIHVIPLLEKEGRLTPDLDHIRLLCPLALAAEDLLHFCWNQDGTLLMLYAREAGRLALTAIDPDTGETVQRLELMDLGPEDWAGHMDRNGLYMVYGNSGDDFVLLREEAKMFSVVLSGKLGLSWPLTEMFSSRSQLAWDGERLALAGFIQGRENQEDGSRQPMGFGAAVWTREGLQYAGVYEYVPGRDWENWQDGYYRHMFDGQVDGAVWGETGSQGP